MLNPEEKKDIEKEISHVPVKQTACIEALKAAQRHRGWISDETLQELAEYLEMSPTQLDSVATFYNLIFRKPVGKHVILICDSISCWIMGYETLLDHLRERLGITLGETTSDNRFTLLPIPCLGICDHAPAFMIDDETYIDLTPEKIDNILDSYK